MTFDDVRVAAISLPGVEDSAAYGTPALKVRGERLRPLKKDGQTLGVRLSFDERELLVAKHAAGHG